MINLRFFPSRRLAFYTVKLFVTRSLAVMIALVLVLMTLDLLGESGKILAVQGNGEADLWRYVALRIPLLISRFLPFSILLGTLIAFTGLNQHSEVVAMKAAGISAHQMLAPLIIASLVIAGGLFADQHWGRYGQVVVSALAWVMLLALWRRSDAQDRPALVACLVFATAGEIFLSLVWGLYEYRLGNIPLFVPPGHVLLFFLGTQIAASIPDRGEWWVAALAAPLIGAFAQGVYFAAQTDELAVKALAQVSDLRLDLIAQALLVSIDSLEQVRLLVLLIGNDEGQLAAHPLDFGVQAGTVTETPPTA
jgi:hypothetical protein